MLGRDKKSVKLGLKKANKLVDNMETKEIINEIDNGKSAVFKIPLKNYFGFIRKEDDSWLGYVDTQKKIKSIMVNIYKTGSKNKIYKTDARIYYENKDISEIYDSVKIYSSEIKENIDEINKLSNGKVSFKKKIMKKWW